MKLVSYNIQYGIGLDGQYDLARICDAVRGADVIALQEVSRNNPRNGARDMVAELKDLLPDYFLAFGPNFEADVGSRLRKDGRAESVMFQFGNAMLSKTPIKLSRNLLLPRSRSFGAVNFQRGALEALVESPLGPLRIYSVHLDHRDPDERLAQIRFLMERVLAYPLEGGAMTGLAEYGLPEPPHPEAYVAMGDFNLLPGGPEYAGIVGRPDHEFGMAMSARHALDVAARLAGDGVPAATWVDPKDPADTGRHKRIDFIFAAPLLAGSLRRSWVDANAVGSDHQPLWLELG